MKTFTLLVLLVFAFVTMHAQDYLITFAGTGAGTTVDSVKVENLTQCTDTSLGGSDILHLTGTVGIRELNAAARYGLHTWPNPVTGNCSVDFEVAAQSNTTLELFDIYGKRIAQKQEFLPEGHHTYCIVGIGNGTYILNVGSAGFSYSAKIICINPAAGITDIQHTGTTPGAGLHGTASGAVKMHPLKNGSVIDMQYNAGDTLKFTGKSGNYHTVFMLIPTQSQTVTFNFIPCVDADSNHYAVVQIGSQVWMAENLKTTRYRDGSAIPNVPDSAAWGSATTGAYCNYHNIPAEGEMYGRLYNFYAVSDSRNICPVGWHVATDAEWRTLENVLGDSTVAGQKLKENCATRWAYYDSAWGTNEAGFTALCSNFRNAMGGWSLAPNNDHDSNFWTSTEYSASMAWFRGLRWCYIDVFRAPVFKTGGYVVRCIKD